MQRDPWSVTRLPAAWRHWLDSLIEREMLRLRSRYELSLDELRGLYISDAQVDALLRERLEAPMDAISALSDRARACADEWTGSAIATTLGRRLGLTPTELAVLTAAAAPDIDVRYESLYAYLNNDITRRHLTIDLACRLLAETSPVDVRTLLMPSSALLVDGALELLEFDPARSLMQQGLRASPLVAQYLERLPLADPRWDERIGQALEPPLPEAPSSTGEVLVHVEGDNPTERRQAAIDWAAEQGTALLWPPFAWPGDAAARVDRIRTWRLGARLTGAAMAFDAEDSEGLAPNGLARLIGSGVPLLVLAPASSAWAAHLAEWPHHRIACRPPDTAQRERLWQIAIAAQGWPSDHEFEASLGRRHALSAARIRAAAVAAASAVLPDADRDARRAELDAQASRRGNLGLARLATPIQNEHGWGHLVLPENTTRQLHEIADAIRVREVVYQDWGMQRRTGRSAGLMLLFCGTPGTGKTMAASVVANAAGLALYRIDLASVVSKYIGETEQNLDRIFRAAESASAVLLFDEADALFGRRSDVKDAHDRYANLEVAYLLQKMEEHDGVVVLASNLPKNLDSAFARRMHYTVEFPRPGPALRERLWRGMLPPSLPRGDDVDFVYLAERFELAGGDIQAATLDAAFLAAAKGSPLSMQHLLTALARRQAQQGHAIATRCQLPMPRADTASARR